MMPVARDYSIALTTLKSLGLLGRPSVYYLCMSLQERALKLSTPPSCRDHKMAQALNIEGIDSSIVLLVAGSGLAEPGVDILVQQRVCKLGRVGYQWELTTFESEAKREDPTCWIRFVPRATNYA
ncbi:hypothetical protein FMUND_11582 [Fusarium mundagurra]|uniref:Uncharacterized protein n=1 Tax=Fusarium mundagurra TaxID=1567541 RepID=A0A8H5Y6E1_9HYPO|nr:hypothetical protein FMUND_11582 [Fusarium mundagurra]